MSATENDLQESCQEAGQEACQAANQEVGQPQDRQAQAGQEDLQNQAARQQEARQEAGRPFKVILASASPRRRELLEKAGVPFVVQVSEVEETLEPDLLADPPEAAKKLAERKAGAVVQELLASEDARGMMIVIGADTMVVKDGQIFGKPKNLSHAKHMLRELAGATHEVVTSVSVWMISVSAEDEVSLGFRTFADTTRVTFHELTDEEIADYLRKGESFDKAGAYAAQGEGAKLIKHIDGSLDTVIGFPVERLLREFPDLAPLPSE